MADWSDRSVSLPSRSRTRAESTDDVWPSSGQSFKAFDRLPSRRIVLHSKGGMERGRLAIVWRSILVFRLNSLKDNEFFPDSMTLEAFHLEGLAAGGRNQTSKSAPERSFYLD
jgi:hypothetical protein